ncbi:rutC family protein UK114 isoform X2 [Apis mellifera]|uniref:RutC family protein UK114 isoform X2 n=1 Tax=Apis mellifera TaxID=7460 RepID=A0A7M7M1F6_APIME|nr:rutC family protein UK114 isoform X2 [Apis mellifera]|eukprot:XP_016772925.2 rutC family protein UK114 isoform X2 [Apis mellifera]
MASQKTIRKIISSPLCPKPVGPYNQAILVNHTLYLSGILGIDVKTEKLVNGGAVAETRQALLNMGHILKEAGSNYNKVFKENYPARSTFQVGKLPMAAQLEIEAIAITGEVETI